MATAVSLCTSNLILNSSKHCQKMVTLRSDSHLQMIYLPEKYSCHRRVAPFHRFRVSAVTKGSAKSNQSDEKIPTWAKPDSDEPPPWAREEQNPSSFPAFEVPYYAYLLASAVTAIAAIGSVFEYINQKPVFGVLNSDSVFYAPLLGFFACTGIPTSGFLWFKSVQAANKAAEEQDRRDGYF
ncbi:hypothetical protein H6P81_001104 [Aristolochia fimbriata]|uniref:Uncharacterized protein n=1 Tax=Aristolochia fimbriata TaxID=158543 RepID=A0AAV7F947_ARIFI|nr:hypothetical protein H6P81_001104 [Aristolochia fimbriata]